MASSLSRLTEPKSTQQERGLRLVPRPSDGIHVAYIMEPPYATFVVGEVMALKRLGVNVTVFNSFRPATHREPEAEALREESHYFPERYKGVVTGNLAMMAGSTGGYGKAASYSVAQGLPLRLLILSAHYARLVRKHGVGHLHAMYGTTPATIAMLTSWVSGVPYSLTCHAYDIYLPNRLLRDKIKGATFVTTVSEFNRRYIIDKYAPGEPDKIRVVYLGADADEWRPPVGRARHNQTPSIVCVAQLIPCKGQVHLIRACALLREKGIDFRCLLIGGGETARRREIELEIERLGLSAHVILTGAVSQEEVRARLHDAEVFALPCIVDDAGYHDGLPVVLMEAMAVGLPVISTRVSGIPELIEDGVSGLLVPQRDPGALADALVRLIGDAKLRAKLASGARSRIEQKFNWGRTAEEMSNLFRRSVS